MTQKRTITKVPTTIPNRFDFRRRSERESFIIPLLLIEPKWVPQSVASFNLDSSVGSPFLRKATLLIQADPFHHDDTYLFPQTSFAVDLSSLSTTDKRNDEVVF